MPPTPPHPRLTLFLDFDGTLTHADTLAALASIPYALHSGTLSPSPSAPRHLPSSDPSSQPPSSSPPPHSPSPPQPPPFPPLSQTYLSALTAHTTTYRPPAPQRTTPAFELAFLASQRGVEEASVRRVEAAGLFRGVRRADVLSAAEEMVGRGVVRVRGGWEGVVRAGEGKGEGEGGDSGRAQGGEGGGVGVVGHGKGKEGGGDEGEGEEGDRAEVGDSGRAEGGSEGSIGKGGTEVYIISVNWSRAWIAGVLDADLRLRGALGTVRELGIHVVANELLGLDEGLGSEGRLDRWWGEGGGGVWTSADKGRVVREVLGRSRGEVEGGWSVYVGDGVGDLEGLLECDVGVCVRDGQMGVGQRELRDVLERVGVRCRWVGEWRGERGGGERVWWAGGWEEIVRSGVLEGGREGC
ncbi:hypothetical protein MMC17_004099 [Xylographa soralifera]|nr:hypothetical protein [Xylographa soralifera]